MGKLVTMENVRERIDQGSIAGWSGDPEDWTGFANQNLSIWALFFRALNNPAQVQDRQATEISGSQFLQHSNPPDFPGMS